MNDISSFPNLPDLAAGQGGIDARSLIVAISFADDTPDELSCPKNNLIGTVLLHSLLGFELERAGLLEQPDSPANLMSGPLNHSLFLFRVTDAHTAARAVMQLLENVSLNTVARIYRWDVGEGVWRCVLPANGDAVDAREVLSLAVVAACHLNLIKAKRDVVVHDLNFPPATPPPASETPLQ